MKSIQTFLFLTLVFFGAKLNAQESDRFSDIERKLSLLSVDFKGLNEKVELSVDNVSLQEFLSALAQANNLNISVDQDINYSITNNFTGVTVKEVILFLCRKYELDVNFMGSIMSFSKFKTAPQKALYIPKTLKIQYNKPTDELSVDLKNDSLYLVAREITKLTGKNIVYSAEIGNLPLNSYVQNTVFTDAIELMAYANNLKSTLTESGFYLLEKKEVETNAKNEKNNKSGSGISFSGKNNNNNQSSISAANGLVTVDASNVTINEILMQVTDKLNIHYYIFSEPKGTTTIKVENVPFDDFLTRLLNGTDFTYKKDSSVYLIGERNSEGLRATKLVQFKYRTVDKIIDFIPADLKKGVDIKAFPDLNGLILSGSQPRIDELYQFMREIDRVVPVISIEILIVDVKNSKTLSTGLKAGLGDAPVKTGGTIYPSVDMQLSSTSINNLISGLNGFGSVILGKVTPNFYINLKLLEEQGVIKLRSTPQLATLNGHEAKLSIGKTEYYLEISNNVIGSQNPQNIISQNYRSVNADLAVSINPIVSGDEQITLDIKVKQSNFTERISPSAPPGTVTRDFQSYIRVKNEEMILLGGLEENSTNESSSGLPLLARVPVIKWFFSSRTKAKSKSKLTIFIKPKVIY